MAGDHDLAQYCVSRKQWRVNILKVEQEALVWLKAAAHFGEALSSVARDAVSSFRRQPGLNSLTRIYRADVGEQAFAVLELVLPQENVPRTDCGYLHVRQQLRSHLAYQVLKRLRMIRPLPLTSRTHDSPSILVFKKNR